MAWFKKSQSAQEENPLVQENERIRRELKRRDDYIAELRRENPTAEQVVEIRRALEAAREKLVNQKEILDKLTSYPLTYAMVVAINGRVSGASSFEKPGVEVRIRRDSEFANQNEGIGTIRRASSDYGWMIVDFEDGYSNQYRIGFKDVDGGICDLEFADVKTDGAATIAIDGNFFEVFLPENQDINPGDTVTVSMETKQIVDIAATQLGGDVSFLRRVIDEDFSEVDYQSSIRVVFNGKFSNLENGDRVVLDSTATVIVRNLGKEDERFSFLAETNVTWNEIGGLVEAKQQMIEAVELPHENPEIFRFYDKRPVKGILLYGPPGCGKTMLGKATATALARIYNGAAKSAGFIYIKGPEILDRFVGVAEATIRQIFQRARKHKEVYGYPAVVFIDEADALLAKRGSGISSDIERTIVPMFLTEMDGLEDSGALIIMATNRPDILDPAIVRNGRVDCKIKIDRPTPESAFEIFMLNLKRVPLSNGYTHEELAKLGSEEMFSARRVLYQIETKSNGKYSFTLSNIVNGGMVASVVDQATSIAMRRDLQNKKSEGLCKDDLVAAVNIVEQQNRDLNYADDLAEFVHDFRDEVTGIKRLRQATV